MIAIGRGGLESTFMGRDLQVSYQQGIPKPLDWISLFDHLDPLSQLPPLLRAWETSLQQWLPWPLVYFWVQPMASPREDQRLGEERGRGV